MRGTRAKLAAKGAAVCALTRSGATAAVLERAFHSPESLGTRPSSLSRSASRPRFSSTLDSAVKADRPKQWMS